MSRLPLSCNCAGIAKGLSRLREKFRHVPAISDRLWNEIAKSAGGLPPEAREEVEKAVNDYRVNDGAEYERVLGGTRKTLKRAKGKLATLRSYLQSLEASSDFRHFNARGAPDATSLAQQLTDLDAMNAALDRAEKRLAKRGRKNSQRDRVLRFFVELLEIRTWYLKIDVPNQLKETTAGHFHKYLELCLEYVEPDAEESERATILKKGIDQAVKIFALRRADPIYSWQWDDLFPQSYASLMKSRRFLKE